MTDRHGPFAQAYRLYVEFETRASSALESLGTNPFGELLATSASNALAIARLANGSIDRGIRAMRVAGLVQLVGELQDRLAVAQSPADRAAKRQTS
jgi:hypothetical protein